jgi:hypothetical protein
MILQVYCGGDLTKQDHPAVGNDNFDLPKVCSVIFEIKVPIFLMVNWVPLVDEIQNADFCAACREDPIAKALAI